MSIESQPFTEVLVQQAFDLACTPMRLRDWRERWTLFGWKHEPSDQDASSFFVGRPGLWGTGVDAVEDRILRAVIPFYGWMRYEPGDHEAESEWEKEREAFDAAYAFAEELTLTMLGPPQVRWADQDKHRHRAAVWGGTHGILILQQAALDVVDGIEVNLWIDACNISGFHPTTPLVDWLMSWNPADDERTGKAPLS